MNVTVVGAGVIGLTSGIRLREAGWAADIVTADAPAETVASTKAGAIWYPNRTSPDDRAARWGARTLDVLTIGARGAEPGLATRDVVELLPEPAPDPWWAGSTRGFRRPAPAELRPGFTDGWIIETVAIDVVPHIEHLVRRFTDLGGSIEHRRIGSLGEVGAPDRLVVNCAGVGARELVPDPGVFPVRGQTVRVEGVPLERVTLVERGPLAMAYVMPHGDHCVLGGTTDAGEWDRTPDGRVADQILEKAIILEPALAGAAIVEVRVGLRPGRASVRLEHAAVDGTPGVIHNYGHGGNGWSLSWGCADEVVRIANAISG